MRSRRRGKLPIRPGPIASLSSIGVIVCAVARGVRQHAHETDWIDNGAGGIVAAARGLQQHARAAASPAGGRGPGGPGGVGRARRCRVRSRIWRKTPATASSSSLTGPISRPKPSRSCSGRPNGCSIIPTSPSRSKAMPTSGARANTTWHSGAPRQRGKTGIGGGWNTVHARFDDQLRQGSPGGPGIERGGVGPEPRRHHHRQLSSLATFDRAILTATIPHTPQPHLGQTAMIDSAVPRRLG